MKIFFWLGTASLFFSSCASSYQAIYPKNLYYAEGATYSGVDFTYQYDVLKQVGNRKYAKKEDKKGLQVVAVKLTNRTGRSLNFSEDISVLSGGVPIGLIEPEIITQQVKQNVPVYSLYLLLSFMNFTTYNEYGEVASSAPVGLFIGPPIAIGNMVAAGSANKKFKTELAANNLLRRTIADGETVYGLISISDNGYRPLSLKIRAEAERTIDSY